ncbi:MAG: pilin [Candidatus Saccharibacteria bacterium]|nr:pilin [Candidatus Saccharibacteria bacterium]
MKYIKCTIVTLAMVMAGATTLPMTAHAQLGKNSVCDGNNNSPVCANVNDGEAKVGSLVGTIVNVLLSITAIISVVMIIVGGIRYATSNGDAGSITGAKNTILYAVIGLVVSMFAYALVNFVVKEITAPKQQNNAQTNP